MNNLIKQTSITLLALLLTSTALSKTINPRKKRGSKNPAPRIQKESDLAKGTRVENGELVFEGRDLQTGIYQEVYGVNDDDSYASFLGHLNASFRDTMDVMTFEFIYGWHVDLGRIELSLARTSMIYDRVADASNGDPDVKDTLISLGAGYGYRSKMIQSLFNSDTLFDTTTLSVMYDSLNETGLSKTFTGFGFKADFGIHSRSIKSMHYGLKLSYHLSELKRPAAFDSESKGNRTIMVTYTTLAFDLTFYF